jgi:hypothetical protein
MYGYRLKIALCIFKLNIRPQTLKNVIYFLVSKLSTHTGLDCVKNSATKNLMLGPL